MPDILSHGEHLRHLRLFPQRFFLLSIAVILLAAGLISGLAHGGKIENIGKANFRLPWLVFLGLGIQAAAELIAALIYPEIKAASIAILLASYSLLIAFVVINRSLPGTRLIGLGLLLNLIVISLNGGMPVSTFAAQALGGGKGYLSTALKHRAMNSSTRAWFLGDIIPLPGLRNIVSIGDVILGAGVFLLVHRLVRYRPRRLAKGA